MTGLPQQVQTRFSDPSATLIKDLKCLMCCVVLPYTVPRSFFFKQNPGILLSFPVRRLHHDERPSLHLIFPSVQTYAKRRFKITFSPSTAPNRAIPVYLFPDLVSASPTFRQWNGMVEVLP